MKTSGSQFAPFLRGATQCNEDYLGYRTDHRLGADR